MIFALSYPFFVITFHSLLEVPSCGSIFSIMFFKIQISKENRKAYFQSLKDSNENIEFSSSKKQNVKNGRSKLMNFLRYYVSSNNHFLNPLFTWRFLKTFDTVCKFLLYPIIPIFGVLFTILYISIGLFIFSYPRLDNLLICPKNN